ncbi:MAG: hypothetical protein EZS28_035441 [Streblomastix strix]|uniref:Uncharacterized protein n=1 Tax=Streblomastix strix TaxID=222440 RepID=A0A5J4UGL1_9EUKA|nr:MAG: hypothetical protein EZS28_035441 [Streblomastix strix]
MFEAVVSFHERERKSGRETCFGSISLIAQIDFFFPLDLAIFVPSCSHRPISSILIIPRVPTPIIISQTHKYEQLIGKSSPYCRI